MPIENKIAQRQEASKKAALPKSHRDDAFSGTLRGDPLQQKSDPEDQATRQPDHLPSIHLYHQKRKRTQHGHFSLSHRTPTVARGRFQCRIVQQLSNFFGSGDCPVTPLVWQRPRTSRGAAGLESPKTAVAIDLVAKKANAKFDLVRRVICSAEPISSRPDTAKPLFYRWIWSSSGINTTLSCSFGSVRAMTATKLSVLLGL